jgi:hypothetical protein
MTRNESWARLQMAMMLAFGGRAPCTLPKDPPPDFKAGATTHDMGLGTPQGMEIVVRFRREGDRWVQAKFTDAAGPGRKLAIPRAENKNGVIQRRPRDGWYYADDLQHATELAGLAAVERSQLIAARDVGRRAVAA